MRITVLGKSPAWQDADGACSGYLVEGGGQTRAARLRRRACSPSCARFVDYVDVDAVVITHLHADHILDLVPFASGAALRARSSRPVDGSGPPPAAADRAAGRARGVRAAVRARPAMTRRPHRGRVRRDDLRPGRHASTLGGLTVRFQPVPHFIPSNAVELADGRRALHVLRRLRAQRRAVRVRRRHRPAADRGDAAAARARRRARAPDAARGGRARRAGGREARWC